MRSLDSVDVDSREHLRNPDAAVGSSVDIADALEEMQPAVDTLRKEVTGLGEKGVKRYLLRVEYGVANSDIAEHENVSPQTVSNQVSKASRRVIKYPRLARTIGTLRAHRANLSQPNSFEEGISEEYEYDYGIYRGNLKWVTGDVGRDLSVFGKAEFESGSKIHHLQCNYMFDFVHGVFIKRLMEGVSSTSWDRPQFDVEIDGIEFDAWNPWLGVEYEYEVYPLPNQEVPLNGPIIDAVVKHYRYDVSTRLIRDDNRDEKELVSRAEGTPKIPPTSAYYCRDDVLEYLIKNTDSASKAIQIHDERVRTRDNLERVMRMYPHQSPYDIPSETLSQLWTGQPAQTANYRTTSHVDKQSLYDLATHIESRHTGRDIRSYREVYEMAPQWNDD
jgi:hypothetical protein